MAPVENPSYENDYTDRQDDGMVQIAEGWEFGYRPGYGNRPECRAELVGVGSGRVRTGEKAQKCFTRFDRQDFWLGQVVEGTTAGQWYRFSVHIWPWSSSGDDPDNSQRPYGNPWIRAGINPWGALDAYSWSTQWGLAWQDQVDRWIKVEVYAQAQGERIAVFVGCKNAQPASHNDFYIDDAELVEWECDGGEPPGPPPNGEEIDYTRIRTIVRQELDRTHLSH